MNRGLIAQSLQVWQRLGRFQRLGLVGLALSAVALLLVIGSWARTPAYGVLFSNLSDEDAAAVVTRLKELRVPYQLSEGGVIRVPVEQVHETRLTLASAGLPRQGGVGFELFNQPTFGMSEEVVQMNIQRALQGELERTIMRLDAVEQARVHLAIPRPSLFIERQQEPTASVVLRLKPGRKLDRNQIQGVAHLVSRSVPGLKPENLTILDGEGNVLSDLLDAAGAGQTRISVTQLETQRELEKTLERNIQAMLGQVLGSGRTAVRVNAQLDWDKVETTNEIYLPDGGQPALKSSHDLTESRTDSNAAGGVPGVDSNVPTYQQPAGAGSASQSQRSEQARNYEVSRRLQTISRTPGSVKRLSVAVLLDQAAAADPNQLAVIERAVAAAAGIDPARGDVITVSALPFSTAELDREREAQQRLAEAQQREQWLSIARIAAIFLGPLLMLLVLRYVFLREPRRPTVRTLGPAAAALGASEAFSLPRPETPPVERAAPPSTALREQFREVLRKDPQPVVEIVTSWLEEDRRK